MGRGVREKCTAEFYTGRSFLVASICEVRVTKITTCPNLDFSWDMTILVVPGDWGRQDGDNGSLVARSGAKSLDTYSISNVISHSFLSGSSSPAPTNCSCSSNIPCLAALLPAWPAFLFLKLFIKFIGVTLVNIIM